MITVKEEIELQEQLLKSRRLFSSGGNQPHSQHLKTT
jgi:hypothetical protein